MCVHYKRALYISIMNICTMCVFYLVVHTISVHMQYRNMHRSIITYIDSINKHVCVYLYVCIYIYMYKYIFKYIYICLHIYIKIHTCIHMNTHTLSNNPCTLEQLIQLAKSLDEICLSSEIIDWDMIRRLSPLNRRVYYPL